MLGIKPRSSVRAKSVLLLSHLSDPIIIVINTFVCFLKIDEANISLDSKVKLMDGKTDAISNCSQNGKHKTDALGRLIYQRQSLRDDWCTK